MVTNDFKSTCGKSNIVTTGLDVRLLKEQSFGGLKAFLMMEFFAGISLLGTAA